MSAHDDSPLDFAVRVCHLLSAGPCPPAVDGRTLAGVPDRRLTVIELVGLFPQLGAAEADQVWRLAAAEAQAGHPAWRVTTAALVAGELRLLARALARCARLAAISDRGTAEAVVLVEFMAVAARADLGTPPERRLLRDVLDETEDRIRVCPARLGRIRAGGGAR